CLGRTAAPVILGPPINVCAGVRRVAQHTHQPTEGWLLPIEFAMPRSADDPRRGFQFLLAECDKNAPGNTVTAKECKGVIDGLLDVAIGILDPCLVRQNVSRRNRSSELALASLVPASIMESCTQREELCLR